MLTLVFFLATATYGAAETMESKQGDVFLTNADARNTPDPFFYLYTQTNPQNHETVVINEDSIKDASFRDGLTVVLLHGHGGNLNDDFNVVIRRAILPVQDCNIIVVDWSFFASRPYATAAGSVAIVATKVASFITEVVAHTNIDLKDIHIVGFNIGAHIAGVIGKSVRGIARITGLDPSRNQFESNPLRLFINDAAYVEVIHTDGGLFGNGLGTNLGHVDFYANGGSNQPGCLTNACSHRRAYELFAASMTNEDLVGYPCSTQLQLNLNLCRGESLDLGNNRLMKAGFGMYRINTRIFYPF